MRLIDAYELKDKLIQLAQDDDLKFWAPVIGACVREIDDAPTIDAVEVVRCKDCKHWETDWTPNFAKSDTEHYCPYVSLLRDADWYCKDGERSK